MSGDSLVNHLYFSAFIFSLIVLADVLIKFRRPLILKMYFILLVMAVSGFTLIYNGRNAWLVLLLVLLKSLISISLLKIFSILYFPKLKFWINVYSISIFVFILSLFVYVYRFNGYDIFSLSTETVGSIKLENFSYPIYFKIFRVLIHISFFSMMIYFWYNLTFKFKHKNIYFNKIRRWSAFVVAFNIISLIFNITYPAYITKPIVAHSLGIYIDFNILLLVFYRPGFLNRSALKIAFGSKFNQNTEFINENEFIMEFFNKLYFINSDASLENLAKKLQVNSNDLYRFVYNKYSMSFNDLINKNRVDYFIDIIHNNQYKNYTIDALAKEVGFSSRQHLYKPFKKFHGGNPSDIIDAINS